MVCKPHLKSITRVLLLRRALAKGLSESTGYKAFLRTPVDLGIVSQRQATQVSIRETYQMFIDEALDVVLSCTTFFVELRRCQNNF